MTAHRKPAPEARVSTLTNGARVASVRLSHVARSHVAVMLRGGPVCEDDTTWGLSHIVEHMVFRGTAALPDARAVSLAADAFGGELGGSTYRDRVVYDTRVDPGREAEALGLIAEMLGAPRFEGLHVEREVLREELLELTDDDGQEVDPDNIALRRLFNGHVLARSIEGTLEHLEACEVTSLRGFHGAAYGPEHMVIAVAGPVSHRAVLDAARATFGRLPPNGGARRGRPPRRLPERRRAEVVRTDASQTSLRLCFPSEGLFGRDRLPLAALSRVLDDGPSSRFQANLIDGEGLAYSLWCTIDLFEERGLLEVGAQVQHDRVGRVIEAVCQELSAITRAAPRAAEMERVRARIRRDLLDMRDDPAQLTDAVGRGVLLGVPFSPARIEAEMAGVTARQVLAAARRIVRPKSAVLVLVGRPPRREVRRAEEALAGLSAR